MDDDIEQEQLYRIQFLQAFGLIEWNDDIINTTINDLYVTIANDPQFKEIFNKAKTNNSIHELINVFENCNDDHLIVFKILFNLDYFDLLHRCLIDYLLNHSLNPKYMNNLLNVL